MSARIARECTWVLTAVVLSLVASGCGGDDPGANGPTEPTASSPTTADSSASPTEPTEPTEPTVAAATGVLMDLPGVSARAPEGWKKNDPLSKYLRQVDDPATTSSVALGSLLAFRDAPLSEQARTAFKGWRNTDRAEVLEPVEIAGVQWWHIGAREKGQFTASRVDAYGTIHDGRLISLTFYVDEEIPAEERAEIIESVQASLEWK